MYSARKDEFLFESIAAEDVKLNFTPIKLHWPRYQKNLDDDELEGRVDFKQNRRGQF